MGTVFYDIFIAPIITLFKWASWLFWPLPHLVYRALKWCWDKIRGVTRNDVSLGDAHFADENELKKSGRFEPEGWLVCKTGKGSLVFGDKQASLIVLAQKGLGKTLLVIANIYALRLRKPQKRIAEVQGNKVEILQRVLPNRIIYDPKGTVLAATESVLHELGVKVFLIDMTDPDHTPMRFPAFCNIRMSDIYDVDRQIEGIAQLLCPAATTNKSNEHFENYPWIMMAGIIKYMMKASGGTCTLYDCVSTLVDPEKRDKTFKLMKTMSSDLLVKGAVDVWESVGDKEKGSFISTNFRKLRVWLRASTVRITSAMPGEEASINWNWENVIDSEEPVFIFIKSGLGTDEGEVVRLIMGSCIMAVMRRWNQTGKPLTRPFDLIIDEPKSLGFCHAVMLVNRELREAGMTLFMPWLSFADLKDAYPYPHYETLLSGSDLIVFGNSNDMDGYSMFKKALGKTRYMSKGESESDAGTSKSQHETEIDLMSESKLASMPFDKCAAVMRSNKGLVRVYEDKPFKLLDGGGVKFL